MYIWIDEGERPSDVQEGSFACELCFLNGREVLGPSVASNIKYNTVQALVIRTHHASLDGRQVVSVKKRKRAREPKGSDATAIIARPRSGARILQQDELVAVLQSPQALHIVGDP